MPRSPSTVPAVHRMHEIPSRFPQPLPAEVLKGQSLRDGELWWLGDGHLHLQSKAQPEAKLIEAPFTSAHLRFAARLHAGLTTRITEQRTFFREAMLLGPASPSPRAHLRLALRLLASEAGQCESTI